MYVDYVYEEFLKHAAEYERVAKFAHNRASKTTWKEMAERGGPGCLNSFSASISGASAGVRLPSGVAVA